MLLTGSKLFCPHESLMACNAGQKAIWEGYRRILILIAKFVISWV